MDWLGCRAGVGTEDEALTRWLRSNVQTPLVLVANKCEKGGRNSGTSSSRLASQRFLFTPVRLVCVSSAVAGIMCLHHLSQRRAPPKSATGTISHGSQGCCGAAVEDVLTEATRLGLGEPVAISAATGEMSVVTARPACSIRTCPEGNVTHLHLAQLLTQCATC